MRALVFQGIESVGVETVPDPKVEAAEDVLVRVEVAGLCGSDLHPYAGREAGLDPGTAMGHEAVGRVVEVGSAVERFSSGDRVVSPFTTSCGSCFFCESGLTSRCERGQLFGWRSEGRGLHGAQAELLRVPLGDSTLVAVPDAVRPEHALMAGDVLATGWHAAVQGAAAPGSRVAVLGCGAVGLCATIALREMGADEIVAVDGVEERLAVAAGFGATAIRLEEDTASTLLEATEGRGFDVVIEAVGSPGAGRLAYEIVQVGGTVSTVGVHTAPHLAFSPSEAYDKNLTYRVGRCPARSYMERLLGRLVDLGPDLDRIVTRRLALDEGADAYQSFAAREPGWIKAVFQLAGD